MRRTGRPVSIQSRKECIAKMMDTIKIPDHGKTKIVAHRGLSGIERENTCSAFVAAGFLAVFLGFSSAGASSGSSAFFSDFFLAAFLGFSSAGASSSSAATAFS